MRTPILAAVVVTAAIAGAVLAMGPSNASASDDFPAADVLIMEPDLDDRTTIIGPIIHVTVQDGVAPIVKVDIYGPVIVIGPGDDFMPPVINIITDGR